MKNYDIKFCSVEDCLREAKVRKLCTLHYQRQVESGELKVTHKKRFNRKTTHNVAIEYNRGDEINTIALRNRITTNDVRAIVANLKDLGVRINRNIRWYKGKIVKNKYS